MTDTTTEASTGLPSGVLMGEVIVHGKRTPVRMGTWRLTDRLTEALLQRRLEEDNPSFLFSLKRRFGAQWLADLRSGKFKAVGGNLVLGPEKEHRCCIGVAYHSVTEVNEGLSCEYYPGEGNPEPLHAGGPFLPRWSVTLVGQDRYGAQPDVQDRVAGNQLMALTGLEGSLGNLNHQVEVVYSGISTGLCETTTTNHYSELAVLNDNGFSYLDIAQVIEADLMHG